MRGRGVVERGTCPGSTRASRGLTRRRSVAVAIVAVPLWSMLAVGRSDASTTSSGPAIVAPGTTSIAIPHQAATSGSTQLAPTGLPSYFDACAVFSPEAIGAAIGQTLTLRDTLGPEGFEAASCAYLGPFSALGQLSIDVRAFTRASVEGAGSDYSVDGAFVGDFPIDPASAVDVVLGDRAQFGHEVGTDQISELTVRDGDVRLIVGVAGDPTGGQATAIAAAAAMLQILTTTPPPPDPVLADGSLSPAVSSYVFGDGREFDVRARVGANRNAVLAELDGPVTSGRSVYFNGDVPPELDLRRYALSSHGADRIAVLEFAGPLGVRTTWNDVPIAQRIEVIFTPPAGGTAVGVAIEPDGSGAVVTDPGGAASISGVAPVLITGNWAALVIPGSLGVGADWSVTATVRMESATPLSTGSDRTGWALETVPVSVGALTGEAGSSVVVGNASILDGLAAGSPSGAGALVIPSPLPTPTITSVSFDATGGHRTLSVTFDRPLTVLPAGVDPASIGLLVRLELAPPGALSSAPPLSIGWNLMTDASGADVVPASASVSSSGGIVASVPLTASGSVVTIELDRSTPVASTPPPPTTASPDTTVPAGVPTLMLGGPTQKLRLNVVLSADQCLCPTGAPEGYDPTGLVRDSVSVIVSGAAIAITRQSTGSTAVGAVDPATGDFEASNATEFWSGTLDSGLIGEYAVVGPAPAAAGLRITTAVARRSGGGWGSVLDPLNDAANAASGGGAPAAPGPQVIASPCGPTVTYRLYGAGGQYIKTTTEPPGFYLPDQSFNQNDYASNYDFGSAVSGRWPPPGCGGGLGIRATAGASEGLPVIRSEPSPMAPSEQTEALPPTLADVSGNWTLRATTFIEQSTGGVLLDQSQFSATIRLDRLTTFSPVGAPNTATTAPGDSPPTASTDTASTAVTASAPSTAASATVSPDASSSPARSSSDSDGGRTGVVIIVLAVVVVAGIGVAAMKRRRRPH